MIWWEIYLVWVGVFSILAFVLYGWDKFQSVRGGWRIPEKTLHWLALAGGFPGGWAGRAIFNHKTRKGFFLFILIVSTFIHLALILWILSSL